MSIRTGNEIPTETLKHEVLTKKPRGKSDAPPLRLTAPTFPANFGIQEWAMRGELVKAIDSYNNGGQYDTQTGVCWPREFWLQRIFDVMTELGQTKFEKFVPGIWNSVLENYYNTFSNKIIQIEVNNNVVSNS